MLTVADFPFFPPTFNIEPLYPCSSINPYLGTRQITFHTSDFVEILTKFSANSIQ